MKLAEYLMDKGMSQADLARMMDVSQVAVHHWIYKKAPPSAMNMMQLYKLSKGRVGLKDWCEDFYND